MLDKSSATGSHPSLMNSFLGADRPHLIIDTAPDMDPSRFQLEGVTKVSALNSLDLTLTTMWFCFPWVSA